MALDASTVRKEGQVILEQMAVIMRENSHSLKDQVEQRLKDYFAPDTGKFNERVTELLKNGGALERAILTQIGPSSVCLSHSVLLCCIILFFLFVNL